MSELTTEEQQVLYLIEADNDHARYFWGRAKNLKWFNLLKDKDFFCPSKIEFDGNGNALFWNVLDYLERVSEQVKNDNEYGKELLEIIEATVNYSNQRISEGETGINNYHIWWYFVKIINNLPPEVIKKNLSFDDFRAWLLAMKNPYVGGNWEVNDISKKLLPKFLKNDYPAEYAETIIDVITRIRPKKEVKTIFQRGEAELVWNSYYILNAFQKNHEKIAGKCSSIVILRIANKLKEALSYKQQEHYVNIGLEDDVYQIKVSRLPEQKEAKNKIAFKENQYQYSIKQFSDSQLKDIDREIDLLALSNTVPEIEIKNFSYLAKDKIEFVSKIKNNLPDETNLTKAKERVEKLSGLFEGLYSDYSYIWSRSLADGERKHASRAEEVLAIILRDVLLSICRIKPKEGKEILEAFLTEQYRFPIFRRFVLLCMDKFWNEYKGLFNNYFKVIPKALEESDYKVELFDLLKNHSQAFDDLFIEKLKKLIDDVPQYYIEKGEKLTAYWKYKWLAALKDHAEFENAYKEAKEKAKPKDGKDYEPERETFKARRGVDRTPLSKEELLQKPIPEIVKFLEEFKGADSWESSFEGKPSREGLADTLQSAVKENPSKFTNELELFDKTDYFYLNRILRGFNEVWNEGKEIDWGKIFDFYITYFGRDKEKILNESKVAQGDDSGDGKYIWLVDNIVDLIADGSKDDKRDSYTKYFDKAEKIFDLVIPLLKGEKHPDTERDAVTYALNTTLGRTVMAYISFSLRVARATKKKESDWGNKKFERFFKIGIATTIWFGSYLPQINFLDGCYTKEKIIDFANKPAGDYEWRMFMEGYLFGGHIFDDIYHLMRDNYRKAIECTVFEDRDDQRLVEHISLGYLDYGEALEKQNNDEKPSLFRKMLNEAKSLNKQNRWLKVVDFFWSVSGRKAKRRSKKFYRKRLKRRFLTSGNGPMVSGNLHRINWGIIIMIF